MDAGILVGRREAFFAQMEPESVGLWMSPGKVEWSPDVCHPFRQRSELLYLSGCEEEGSVLVLEKTGGSCRSHLFLRGPDPVAEQWDGHRMGVDEAKVRFGVERVEVLDELGPKLVELLAGKEAFYVRLGQELGQDQEILGWVNQARGRHRRGRYSPLQIVDPGSMLGELRLCKGDEEIRRLREAGRISALAMEAAQEAAKPGVAEHEVEAAIIYAIRKRGGVLAFAPIVASGPNATVLHYHAGAEGRVLEEGELLLLDLGARWQGYAADCSRTMAVGGSFCQAQGEIHGLVSRAQEAAIAACQPGHRLEQVEAAARRVLTQGLVELGVLEGEVEELLAGEAYKPYFMHGVSHWVGLDVHDPGARVEADGSSRILEAGMVLTVEPGLYFLAGSEGKSSGAARSYAGIGVRIEDTVLLTEGGPTCLTR